MQNSFFIISGVILAGLVSACSTPPAESQNSNYQPLIPRGNDNTGDQDGDEKTALEYEHVYIADWHSLSTAGAGPTGIVHATLSKKEQIPAFRLAAEVPYPLRLAVDSERRLMFVVSYHPASGPSSAAHLYAFRIDPVTGELENVADNGIGSILQVAGGDDRQLFMRDVALHPSLPIVCISYESYYPEGNRYGADRIRCYEYSSNPFKLTYISENLSADIYRPLTLEFVNEGSHVVVAGWGNGTNHPTITSYRFNKQSKSFTKETQLSYPGFSLHTIIPHPKNPNVFFATSKFEDGSENGITKILSFSISNNKELTELDRLYDDLGFFVRNIAFNKESDVMFASNSATDGENEYKITSVEINSQGMFGSVLDERNIGSIAAWDLIPIGKDHDYILATKLKTSSLKGSLVLYRIEDDETLRFIDEKSVSFSPRNGLFVRFEVEENE